ncbi:hypothetical protein JCM11251_006416 [Rhodosporidiobolus azoricus]
MAKIDSDSDQHSSGVTLPLVKGRTDEPLTVWGGIHLAITLSVHFFFFLPIRTIASYTLLRLFSPQVRTAGRPIIADYIAKATQFFCSRCSVPQARLVFNRTTSYAIACASPSFTGVRNWISKVEVNGTSGRWLAKPGSKRSEDDVVVYYIHGGGFTTDTGAASQEFFLKLIKQLKEKSGLTASVFSLDYQLAPEYKYPSQLIEVLAGYHYLVNDQGIDPSKIVVAGDSAGGNLTLAFLLHLARPAKGIELPSELGPTPEKPAGALLISPEVNVASLAKSIHTNIPFDILSGGFVFRGACDYIGARLPFSHRFRTRWLLNPLWHLVDPQRLPPVPADQLSEYEGWVGWKDIEEFSLFKEPYVNPAVQKDSKWWKEAMPDHGKTVVAWGGLEVLADDIEEFYGQLKKAGVEPKKLFKPYGIHNWLTFDYIIPFLSRTKSRGPDRDFSWGLNNTIDFLTSIASSAKEASSSGKSKKQQQQPSTDEARTSALEQKEKTSNIPRRVSPPSPRVKPTPGKPPVKGFSFAAAAASTEDVAKDAPIVVKGEGKTLEAHLEDGKLLAEKQQPKKEEATLPPIPKPTQDAPADKKQQEEEQKKKQKKEQEEKEKKAQEEAKAKAKKAKKPVPPVPAPGEEGGSFAAAAKSKALADDAAVVAKGEGDVLAPKLDEGHVVAEVKEGKVAAAGKNGGAANGGGAGSWAKVAASHDEVAGDAPIVAEGEGAELKASLQNGALHAEAA